MVCSVLMLLFATVVTILLTSYLFKQRNLTEYVVAVDVNNMLQLYASMLHERRIIITSSKLSTVSTSHISFSVEYIERFTKWPADLCGFRYVPCVLIRQYLHTFLIYGFSLALEVQKSDLCKTYSDTLSRVNYFPYQ